MLSKKARVHFKAMGEALRANVRALYPENFPREVGSPRQPSRIHRRNQVGRRRTAKP